MPEEYIIRSEDELIRRIPLKPSHTKIVNGELRPTSAAFKTSPKDADGLSVDIMALTSIEKAIPNRTTHTGAILLARIPIDEGYECKHTPEPFNDAHAIIVGDTSPIAKKLAEKSVILKFDYP